MSQVTLTIPDISCEHCANAVSYALRRLKGVEEVDVNIADKQAQVAFDDSLVNVDAMKTALAEKAYPVASVTVA